MVPARRDRTDEARPKPVFSSPFKDLGKLLAAHAIRARQVTPAKEKARAPSPAVQREPADSAILREAYAGVTPIEGRKRPRIPVQPEVSHTIVSDEAEVLAELYDLISGQGSFDLTETEEYIEGARTGIEPRLVTRLRRGDFAIQAHVDLHGMIQQNAREALTAFIVQSVRKGHRAVLVVHGRGLGSPGGRPILKHAAARWLSHGTIGGHVLAFTTARPQDGGAGAMYVLLRRDRRRGAFDVLGGAKRRN